MTPILHLQRTCPLSDFQPDTKDSPQKCMNRKILWKIQETPWDTHRWYLWDWWQGPWDAGCSLTVCFGFSQLLWKMHKQERRCEILPEIPCWWLLKLVPTAGHTKELTGPTAWHSQAVHAARMPWDTPAPWNDRQRSHSELWPSESSGPLGVMTVLSGLTASVVWHSSPADSPPSPHQTSLLLHSPCLRSISGGDWLSLSFISA